jgi:hypothetical protein
MKVLVLENRDRQSNDEPSHHLFFVEAQDRWQGTSADGPQIGGPEHRQSGNRSKNVNHNFAPSARNAAQEPLRYSAPSPAGDDQDVSP